MRSPAANPAAKKIQHSYLLCATPRTGSTLLQEALKFTQIAGNPLEYFGLSEEHWLTELSREPGETYVEKVLSSGTTKNGMFGAKVLRFQFTAMMQRLRAHFQDEHTPAAPFLNNILPDLRYIWIRRTDKLAQAISEVIATQTMVWQQVEYNSKKKEAKEPVFDFKQIQEALAAHAAFEQEWEVFFAENGVAPLMLDYEKLVSNYVETIYEVLTFLDLPTSAPIRRPRLVKQADARSQEWIERYQAMTTEQEALPTAETLSLTPEQAFEQAVQLHKLGRAREAEARYQAVLRVVPEHVDSLHNMGLLRLEAGKADEAATFLKQVIDKVPGSARVLNNYGVAIDTLKRHDEAVGHFTRALVLTPHYPECQNNLGNSLQMLGRYDEAIVYYQKALALKPDYVDAHRNLGRALLSQSEACRARAAAHFNKALTLKPEDAEAYCGLGMAHQTLIHYDKALDYLAKSVALDPSNQEARKQLAVTVAAAERRAEPKGGAVTAVRYGVQIAENVTAARGAA